MAWLALIKGLVGFAHIIAKYAADKQLIDAGESKAFLKTLEKANEQIQAADTARRNAGVNGLSHDKNDRNNRK